MGDLAGPQGPLRGALPNLPLFSGLPERDHERLRSMANRRVLPAGGRLPVSARGASCVYVIRGGYLKAVQENDDGEEVIVAIFGPGDLIGELGLAAERENSSFATSALAIGETELIVFGRQAFCDCLATMPVFSLNLLGLYAAQLRHVGSRVESLASADVEARVARLLRELARAHGVPAGDGLRLPYRITQAELACMVGASRVRVNQTFGELRKSGQVTLDDGHVVVRERAMGAVLSE